MESEELDLQQNESNVEKVDQAYENSINNNNNNNDYDDEKQSDDISTIKLKYKSSQNRSICHRGIKCPFAHSENELREKPNLVKTKLCEAFLEGMCKLGDQCPFAHGENELRSTPDLFKTALCQLWRQGKCSSAETCRFAHGFDDLRPMKYCYPEQFMPLPQVQPNFIPMPNFELSTQYYQYGGGLNYYENYPQVHTLDMPFDLNGQYAKPFESIPSIPKMVYTNNNNNNNKLNKNKDLNKVISIYKNSKQKVWILF